MALPFIAHPRNVSPVGGVAGLGRSLKSCAPEVVDVFDWSLTVPEPPFTSYLMVAVNLMGSGSGE